VADKKMLTTEVFFTQNGNPNFTIGSRIPAIIAYLSLRALNILLPLSKIIIDNNN
jgi:hypothetical protein